MLGSDRRKMARLCTVCSLGVLALALPLVMGGCPPQVLVTLTNCPEEEVNSPFSLTVDLAQSDGQEPVNAEITTTVAPTEGVTITNGDTENILVTPTAEGSYTVTVTATADGANAGSATCQFTFEQVPCTTAADCDDNDACTTDACTDSVCSNTPVQCPEGQECQNGNCVEVCDGNDDCDDGDACNGAETCVNGACQAGTAVDCDDDNACTEDTCDPATGQCTNEDTSAECDDGVACTDDSCDPATGCVNADNCPEGETCNTTTGQCEGAGGFNATITGCPTGDQASGTQIALTGSATGGQEGGVVTFSWTATGGATLSSTTGANVTVTMGDQTSLVTLTATDTCTGCNDPDGIPGNGDETDIVQTDTATCTLQFNAQALNVEAGSLDPERATNGAIDSGDPGTAGNNALNGSVLPPSFTGNIAWSVVSQPAGSGTITFDNDGEEDTGWRIAPPARAGEYVFQLTATDTTTGEAASDTVTLLVLTEPEIVLAPDFQNTRIYMHLDFGAGGEEGEEIEVPVVYTAGSELLLEFFRVATGTPDEEDDLLFSANLEAGTDADATLLLRSTPEISSSNPAVHQIGVRPTDAVEAEDLGALSDPEDSDPALRNLYLITTEDWITTDDNSNAPVIDLATEVGMPDGGNVIDHAGVGANDPTMDHYPANPRAFAIADLNEDGLTDLWRLPADGDDVKVYFGAPDIVTDGEDADIMGGDDDWFNTDGDEDVLINPDNGASELGSFAVGDFDSDGHLDVVVVEDNAGTDDSFVRVYLLDGADTAATVTTPSRTYSADDDTDLNGINTALAGDVNDDGIDDIIAVASLYDDEFDGMGNTSDGVIFVIYGVGDDNPFGNDDLPTSNRIAADEVSGETPAGTFNGERVTDGAANSNFGTAVGIGQFLGGENSGLEIAAAQHFAATPEVRVFQGGSPRLGVDSPARTIVSAGASDLFQGGYITFGDVMDAVSGNEMIVTAPDDTEDKVYFIPNTIAASANFTDAGILSYDVDNSTVNSATGDLAPGDAVTTYDVNFDGAEDILIGDTTTGRVLVIFGPLGNNNPVGSDVDRVYANTAVGNVILFGDINGDGLDDFLIGDDANADLYSLVGLHGQGVTEEEP